MKAKIKIYSILFLLISNKYIFSINRLDVEAHHPEVLIEDLVNLTDVELELKDPDQLEHLLMIVDDELRNPQNDFDGEFNIPEITDHEPGIHFVGAYSKEADLQRLKQKISNILRIKDEAGRQEIPGISRY